MKFRPNPPHWASPRPSRRPRSLLDDPVGSVVDFLVGRVDPYKPGPEVKGYDKDKEFEAHHGSPYDFDAFDIDRLLTGEGANAYGPGLYMTETENVARGYARELARRKVDEDTQADVSAAKADYDMAMGRFYMAETDFHEHRRRLQSLLKTHLVAEDFEGDAALQLEARVNANPIAAQTYRRAERARKRMDKAWRAKVEAEERGKQIRKDRIERAQGVVYNLRVGADRGAMIDLDTRVRDQPDVVKAALMAALARLNEGRWNLLGLRYRASGKERAHSVVSRLASEMGGHEFMDHMAASGVPGIYYKDGFSRVGRKKVPTYNYVSFRDDLIKIVGKYTIPALKRRWD